MNNKMLWIVVEDMFEGTLKQFRNNFCSNADKNYIINWTKSQGYKAEFFNLNDEQLINVKNIIAANPVADTLHYLRTLVSHNSQ